MKKLLRNEGYIPYGDEQDEQNERNESKSTLDQAFAQLKSKLADQKPESLLELCFQLWLQGKRMKLMRKSMREELFGLKGVQLSMSVKNTASPYLDGGMKFKV